MTRDEFIRMCSLLGLSVPFQSILTACDSNNNSSNSERNNSSNSSINNRPESVIIIGAGAAGMSAGYLLSQQNIDFTILEAKSDFGGRMACATSISNFPTPLGAEWVHTSANVFSEIVNDNTIDTSTPQLQGYNTTDLHDLYSNGVLTSLPLGRMGAGEDRKFINSCWKEFFSDYIVPSISDNINYNTPVSNINYTGDKVMVTANGNTYEADKCIITVPLKILQEGSINFSPSLPDYKQQAISSLEVMPGFKCFIKTSQKFYNTYLLFDDTFAGGGQWIYYDAAYGQNTTDNILGFLCVGPKAANYPYQDSAQLLQAVTIELEEIYGADQVEILDFEYTNWDEEPYIKGSYLGIEADAEAVLALSRPVDDKIYFAGCAYTNQNQNGGRGNGYYSQNWSNVHAATRAAKRAVEEIFA